MELPEDNSRVHWGKVTLQWHGSDLRQALSHRKSLPKQPLGCSCSCPLCVWGLPDSTPKLGAESSPEAPCSPDLLVPSPHSQTPEAVSQEMSLCLGSADVSLEKLSTGAQGRPLPKFPLPDLSFNTPTFGGVCAKRTSHLEPCSACGSSQQHTESDLTESSSRRAAPEPVWHHTNLLPQLGLFLSCALGAAELCCSVAEPPSNCFTSPPPRRSGGWRWLSRDT